ncbi:hypothetical protein Bca52824_073387 [Brassica carinata]|uniref:Uncharacterized protein n=1 Tax=Brassica carinata TaxID=52824 RepID=A0A8X7QB15_BRACI|nr:hypothetical protein Bca52824_073387 [Brassica carinata]
MNPESLSFLFSLVGFHARLRRPFTDPFSSPVPSWGNVPEADSEAVSMAPLRRLRSCFFDDGPRSETREGDLANIRRMYLIHPSMGSSIFDPVTALLWLRNLRGVSEVITPSGMVGTAGVCVSPGFLRWRSSGEAYNGNSSAIPLGDLSGNVTRSPALVVFDEYQKVRARKRRLSCTPPPRLARAALSAGDSHRRLTSEVLLLRGQVQDMMACRDLLIQQVRASARWELMKEWLEKRIDHWNLKEEYRRHLFLSGGFNHRSGDLSQIVTPRSVIGSRFSEGPSF